MNLIVSGFKNKVPVTFRFKNVISTFTWKACWIVRQIKIDFTVVSGIIKIEFESDVFVFRQIVCNECLVLLIRVKSSKSVVLAIALKVINCVIFIVKPLYCKLWTPTCLHVVCSKLDREGVIWIWKLLFIELFNCVPFFKSDNTYHWSPLTALLICENE